jgi:hypothetical protein
VFNRPINGASFLAWVKQFLAPTLERDFMKWNRF